MHKTLNSESHKIDKNYRNNTKMYHFPQSCLGRSPLMSITNFRPYIAFQYKKIQFELNIDLNDLPRVIKTTFLCNDRES